MLKGQLGKDAASLWVGDWTLELYFPALHHKLGKDGADYSRTQLGVVLPTLILYVRPRDGWRWNRSLALKVLGFGFGVAYQHCENPNMKGREPAR